MMIDENQHQQQYIPPQQQPNPQSPPPPNPYINNNPYIQQNPYYQQPQYYNPNGYPPQYPQQNYNQPQYIPPQYNPQQQYNMPNGGYQYNLPPQNTYQQYIPHQPIQPMFVPTLVQPNGIPVSPRPEERKWIKHFYNWTGGTLLIHFAMTLILTIIISAIFYFANSMGNIFNHKANLTDGNILFLSSILAVTVYPISNIVCTLIGTKLTKIKIKSFFKPTGFGVKTIVFAAIIALGIQAVCGFVITVLNGLFNVVGLDILKALDQPESKDLLTNILNCIYACILAPITEELLFRGVVLKNLSRFNVKFGIILTSVLFGLVHGNIPQFIFAFTLGLLLAYITVKSDSIIPAIVVHMIVNSFATLQGMITDEKIGTLVSVICSLVFLFAAIAVIIILAVNKKIKLPKADLPKKKRGLRIFITSAPCIIVAILYVILNFTNISLK